MLARIETVLTILETSKLARMVDIGANPLEGGQPPYRPLLQRGLFH